MSDRSEQLASKCFLGKHGYAFDIFFSYSHGDVRGKGDAALKRWSRQLYEALSDTLDSLNFRPPPRIFFDDSPRSEDGISKNTVLGEQLTENVRSSAIFQLVMSPQYLNSRWCRAELAAFDEARKNSGRNALNDIFVAKALNTDKEEWPEPFGKERESKPIGWYFHERGNDVRLPYGWAKEWRHNIPDEMDATFRDMVHSIQKRLLEIDAEHVEKAEQERLASVLQGGNADRIYLYGRSEDEAEWQAAFREIDRLGFHVQPGEPEPLDADDDARKREEYARLASRCDAMVMVGADGTKLDFDLDVVGRERRNFIASKYKKYLPCAVLDRRGGLAKPARVSNAKKFGIDWIDPEACNWPDYFKEWLQSSAEAVRQRYGLEANAT